MHITPLLPALTAQEVAVRLADRPGLAWLDGGLTHGREGRLSFLASDPVEVREVGAGTPPWTVLSELGAPPDRPDEDRDAILAAEDVPRWIGHIAYDAYWAGRGGGLHARGAAPTASFARYDALVVWEHERGETWIVGDDEAACDRLVQRIREGKALPLAFRVGPVACTPEPHHKQAITRALEHIREGNIYQVNLARRFQASFSGSTLGLFLAMRRLSPVPLGAYLAQGKSVILGRSMERFLRYRRRDGRLWTCPIKGTLARTGNDVGEAAALRADPKEHAEHAMVVDLMRNDLGRVAQMGTVAVDELMAVLPFAGLSHLVSTVSAIADPALSVGKILEATFAPGSVTGTPKKRAMEIIEELEPEARGVYTGAYGFIDRCGGFSLAVAIRTATVCDQEVTYWAGGGIVEASDPEKETAETELKARVFLDACREGA